MELEELIYILEKSVEKNGEKPMTNKWLLNILRNLDKSLKKRSDDYDRYASACIPDLYN